MKSVRVVCAHDCPDMCSLIAHVEDGKVVRVQGDPDHPYTAGFACGKVNRDADLVNSPERIATPLRRSGPKGSGRVQADHLGRGARRDRRQVEVDHPGKRPARPAGLRLLRPSGADEPRPGERPLPCAGRLAPAGRHGVRHLLRDGVGHDAGPGGRRRSRNGRAFRPGDLVGRRPRRHQRAFLGTGRGAEEAARRADRGDRSAPHAQRQGGRFLPADPHRHRCGPGARRHAHPGARQARRPRLHRPAHHGFRQGRTRDPAEIHAGADGRDHRTCRRRHREAGGDVRQGQGRADPPRRGHDPPHPWRPGAAHRGAAARRQRPLRGEGRRCVSADGGVVRPQLCRRAQAVGPCERAPWSIICGWAKSF